MRAWADRFDSYQGQFATAMLSIGPVSFTLSLVPSEHWSFRIWWRPVEVVVRW